MGPWLARGAIAVYSLTLERELKNTSTPSDVFDFDLITMQK